jgi:hypothetical protein
VEHSFSKGGLTVSRFRHSLSDDSTCASSVVGMWAKLPNAIPHDTIVDSFKEKSSCSAAKKAKSITVDDSDIEIVNS